jgi:hypothetical protein
MNFAHRWLCRSAYWRNAVETYILPWVLDGLEMGANVLEVGPGPGVTTDLLRGRVEHLTSVEIDRGFADSLSRRMSGLNVTVVRQDATAMSFPDATFDGAVSFTMLHHVSSEQCKIGCWRKSLASCAPVAFLRARTACTADHSVCFTSSTLWW